MRQSNSLIAALALILASCTSQEAVQQTNRTLDILGDAVAQGKCLYAHQDDRSYGHAWHITAAEALTDDLSRSDIQMVCGDYPAILGLDLGGIEKGDKCNLDSVSFDLMRRAAIEQDSKGGLVTFSWHLRNPLTGGTAWDNTNPQTVASVLEGGECHDLFMEWLKRTADYLETIKDAEGNPIPAIFRPWHEHTGSWFWWGRDLCSIEEYVALWKLTYDYIATERGMSHLVWAYSPGGGNDEATYMERYPGDEIIDILGLDCYQYSADNDVYAASIDDCLTYMDRLGQEHGKIIAVTETGYESIPYATWWTEVLAPVLAKHNVSYVLTWRNAWDKPTHYYGPWEGSTDAEDFKAFHDLDRIVFLNELN